MSVRDKNLKISRIKLWHFEKNITRSDHRCMCAKEKQTWGKELRSESWNINFFVNVFMFSQNISSLFSKSKEAIILFPFRIHFFPCELFFYLTFLDLITQIRAWICIPFHPNPLILEIFRWNLHFIDQVCHISAVTPKQTENPSGNIS